MGLTVVVGEPDAGVVFGLFGTVDDVGNIIQVDGAIMLNADNQPGNIICGC